MGELLKRYPRHTLIIATKVCWPMSDEVNDRGLSRKHIMESIDKSLKRLGTDYVDIYWCHRPDPETPMRETAQAMNTLIEQGKVIYWGTSEWSAAQLIEAHSICEKYGWHLPQAEQPQYSLLVRQRVEQEILPAAQARGIGLMPWSPLAQGLLTGKYDLGLPEESRFAKVERVRKRYWSEKGVEQVRQLKAVADGLGITRGQLALAWALRNPAITSLIIGASNPEQLAENLRTAEMDLPEDALQQIDEIFPPTTN